MNKLKIKNMDYLKLKETKKYKPAAVIESVLPLSIIVPSRVREIGYRKAGKTLTRM